MGKNKNKRAEPNGTPTKGEEVKGNISATFGEGGHEPMASELNASPGKLTQKIATKMLTNVKGSNFLPKDQQSQVLSKVQGNLEQRQVTMKSKIKDMNDQTQNFQDLRNKGEELEKKNQESKSAFAKKKNEQEALLNKTRDSEQSIGLQNKQVTEVKSNKELELKDKQKKLQATMNATYTEIQKKDQDFDLRNEQQDKRIAELREEIAQLKIDIKRNLADINELDAKIDVHEDKRIDISSDLTVIPVEKETSFDPAGLSKAQKEKEQLDSQREDMVKDLQKKTADKKQLQDDHDALERELADLKDHQNVDKVNKQDRDKKKIDYNLKMENQRKIFNENIEQLEKINDLEEDIEDKEKQLIELNGIIHTLLDQNEFERRCANLESQIRDLEDDINDTQNKSNEVGNKIDHTLAKSVGDTKVQSLLDQLHKLKGDVGTIDEKMAAEIKEKDQNRKDLLDKASAISGKKLQEIKPDELQKCLDDLDFVEHAIHDNKEDQEKLKVDLKKVEEGVQEAIDGLKRGYHKEIKEGIHEIKDRENEIEKRVGVVNNKLDDLDKKIKERASALDDPDKQAMLDKMKRKVNDLYGRGRQIMGDKDTNVHIADQENEKCVKAGLDMSKFSQDSYEQVKLETIQDIDDKVDDTKDDVEQSERDTDELEKKVKNLELELDEFNKMIADEKLEQAKDALAKKAEELKAHEDGLKNLEDGIADLKKKIADKEGLITNPHHKKALDDLKNRLGDLERKAKDMRAKKDKLQKDHDALKKKVDDASANPDSITLDDVLNLDKDVNKLNKDSDDLKDQVKEGQEELKKLNNDFNKLLNRTNDDKRYEAQRKLKQAGNQIDDLDKKLDNIQLNLDLIQKNKDFLNDGFKDAEKAKDQGELQKAIDAQQKEFDDLKAKRDDYAKKVKALDDKAKAIQAEEDDGDLSSLDKWVDMIGEADKLNDDIKSDVAKAGNLDNGVAKSKDKSDDQVTKYKAKKDLYDECVKERDAKKEQLEKDKKRMDDIKDTLDKLQKDLDNTSVPADDKKNQDLYEKLKKEQDRLKKNADANEKKLKEIEDKLNPLSDQLDSVDRETVTTPELQSILDRLRNLPFGELTLDQLEKDVAKHEKDVDDFCKQYRGEKLYEVDRQIKETEDLLDKLEKLHKQVKGDVDGFTDFLNENNNDPEERERVQKIEGMLKKCGEFDGDCKKTGKDIGLIRGVLDGIKAKMADQASGTVDLGVVNDLIKDVGTCNDKIKKNIGKMEEIDEELKKMKVDFDNFGDKSKERESLIQDFNGLIDANQQALDSYGPKFEKIYKLLNGLDTAADAMNGNPDYEPKQKSIEKMQQQLKDQRGEADKAKKTADSSQFKLDEFKAKQDNLKNMEIPEIQKLIEELEQTLEEVQGLKPTINDLERALDNRREKLRDAEIHDNVDTKDKQLQGFGNKLDEAEKELADLTEKANQSLANAPADAKAMFEGVRDHVEGLKKKREDLEFKRNDAVAQLEKVKEDIAKAGDLNTIDAENLKPLIDDLRDIRNLIDQIDEGLKDLDQEIAVQKAKLEGLDSEKKLKQLNDTVDAQAAKAADLLNDIDRLQRLAKNFDGLATGAEEESFIEELHSELENMKEKAQDAEKDAAKLKLMVKDIEKFTEDKKKGKANLSNEDIDEIVTKIAHADQQVKKNQGVIDQVEGFVEAKKDRFCAMDLDKKYKRRQRELDELGKHMGDMTGNIIALQNEMKSDLQKAGANAEGNKELINTLNQLSTECDETLAALKNMEPERKSIEKDLGEARAEITKPVERNRRLDLIDTNLDIKRRLREQLKELNDIHSRYKQAKAKYGQHKNTGPKIQYKAAKGDQVDEMLGEWLNTHGMGLRIKRLGGGYYMFGTKKIYAKIINGKLVIRVGGGYMGIDEFMQHYGLIELQKQQRMGITDDDEGENIGFQELGMQDEKNIKKLQEMEKSPTSGGRKSVIGIGQAKKALRGSNAGKSPVSGRKSDASDDGFGDASTRTRTKTVAGSKLQAPKTYAKK